MSRISHVNIHDHRLSKYTRVIDIISLVFFMSIFLYLIFFSENTETRAASILMLAIVLTHVASLFLRRNRNYKLISFYLVSLVTIPIVLFMAITMENVRYEVLLLFTIILRGRDIIFSRLVLAIIISTVVLSLILLGIESLDRVPVSEPFFYFNNILCFFTVVSLILIMIELFYIQNISSEKVASYDSDFESIFENSFDPIAIFNQKNNQFVKVNDKFLALTGYNLSELNKMSILEFIPLVCDEDSKNRYGETQRNFKRRVDKEVNSVLTAKSGDKVHFKSLCIPSKTNKEDFLIIVKNNTLEVRKNEQLRKSRETYQSIFENNLMGIVVLDEDATIKDSNGSFSQMIGSDQAQLFGESLLNYISVNDREQFKDEYKELTNGNIDSFISNIVITDTRGNEYMSSLSVNSIIQKDQFTSAIITIKNIAKEWDAEVNLKASEHRYKSVFKNSLGGIAIIENRRIIEANSAFLRILSAKKEEIIGINPKELLYEEDIDFVLAQFNKELQENIETTQIIHRIDFKNRIRHVVGYVSTLGQDKGMYLLSCIDVTDLLSAQVSLTNYTATLDTVIYNTPESIIAINTDLVIMVMNDKAKELLLPFCNVGSDIEIGNNITKIINQEYFEKCPHDVYHKVLTGKTIVNDVELFIDNELRNYNRKVSPLINSDGEIIGCVELLSDVTDSKRKEAEIESSRRKYKDIFDNSYEGILLVDYDTASIVNGNHRIILLLGLTEYDDLSKCRIFDFINEDQLDGLEKEDVKAMLIDQLKVNDKVTKILTGKNYSTGNKFIASITMIKDFNDERRRLVFFINDITEEYTAKRELEHTNQLYTTLYNYSFDGIDILELVSFNTTDKSYEVKLLNRNQKGGELVGENKLTYMYAHEIKEILYDDVSLKDVQLSLDKSFADLMQQGYSRLKWKIKSDDGLKKYIEFNINVVVIDNKSLFVRMAKDVTEEVEAIEAVSLSELKYRKLINTLPGGVLQSNNKGIIDYVSNGAASILGYEKENLIGINVFNLIAVEDKDRANDYASRAIEKDDSEIITIQMERSDGGAVYIDARAKISEQTRKGYKWIMTFYESTDRVLAEQARLRTRMELDERNILYQTMIESSFTGIDVIMVDKFSSVEVDYNLLIRNSKMKSILGEDLNIFLENKVSDDTNSVTTSLLNHKLNDLAMHIDNSKDKQSIKYDCAIEIGGAEKHLEVMNSIVEVNKQKLLIRHIIDITERRKKDAIIFEQLDELNIKNDELEKFIESNLQLENFAYIASHDLKAPLRTVSSFAYLLKKKAYMDLDDKSKKYLDIIVASSNNMQILINDLLQFARMNTDKVLISHVSLAGLFKRCRGELSETIQSSKASITINMVSQHINADEIKLGQLVQNLIRNAIKFVKPGKQPVIKIECTESKEEWLFSVSDNGIGIKEQHKNKIFGIFEKLHSNDLYEGTGLGLTICKKIVEKHHGRIWLESEIGMGTTFYFTIKKNLIINDKKSHAVMKNLSQQLIEDAVVA